MLLPIVQLLFIWSCVVFALTVRLWPRVYARGHYRLVHAFFLEAGLKLLVVLVTGYFSINDLLGTTSLEAEVIRVQKAVTQTEITVGRSPSLTVASGTDILKDYQVLVKDTGTRRIMVLNNANSLLRWKFNRKEIQLGLMEGQSYRLRVHRRFGYKNILRVESMPAQNAR